MKPLHSPQLLCIMLCCFLFQNAYSQSDLKLTANNLSLKRPIFGVELGHNNMSIELQNGLILQKWSIPDTKDAAGVITSVSYKRMGYQGNLRLHYYLNPNDGLDGWFIAPSFGLTLQKIAFFDAIRNTKLNAGFCLGRKSFFNDNIGYQIDAGIGYWIIDSYKTINNGIKQDLKEQIMLPANRSRIMGNLSFPVNFTLIYRIREF